LAKSARLAGLCVILALALSRWSPVSEGSPQAGEPPAGVMATAPAPTTSAPATAPSAASAIGWRNDGTGSFPQAAPVKSWDEKKKLNILWKANVGKLSYSSPIVVGDRVLVTAEPAQLVCLDAKDGAKLWEKSNGVDQLAGAVNSDDIERPKDAGNAAATPASDGKCAWAQFGNIVACYDLAGNRKWIKHFANKDPLEYGHSSSPVLGAGKLILTIGCTIAVDPATGNELWRQPKAGETHGTPAVGKLAEMDVLLTCSGQLLRLRDGAVLNKKLPSLAYTSPVLQGDIAYFAGAGRSAYACKLTPAGPDAVKSKQLWESDMGSGDCFASPAISDGMMFIANDAGTLSVFDAKSGQTIYTRQLDIPNDSHAEGAAAGHIYPSPVAAGKYVFVTSDSGDMLIIEPAREYKEVGRCRLAEGSGATPFFAADRIFARSGDNICCIGKTP
jgi:outer membrane protein assembly factor BamB